VVPKARKLTISRLANATHCPDAVTWVQGLGLIESDGTGGYVLTPQATTRVGTAMKARAKPAEALLPAEDCDLLSGREQIARWFGLTCGQCDARIRDGSIITFKLSNKSTTHALKSENMRLWRAAAEAHRDRLGGLAQLRRTTLRQDGGGLSAGSGRSVSKKRIENVNRVDYLTQPRGTSEKMVGRQPSFR
jgi:hypothetical protein